MAKNNAVRKIVIVGGGSAGWLTAGLLAAEYAAPESGVSVTLVESPDVKTVGVGEGTWPTMRNTLRRIGITETDFLTHCNATFKQGTKFVDWVSGNGVDHYYHPFTPPSRYASINLVPHWLCNGRDESFADAVSPQSRVCEQGLAPKQANTPEYAAVVNYAYHLDAAAFADLLQRHCTTQLGVQHVRDHVTSVNGSPDEDIRSLGTAGHGELAGDLFIDCTGFAALLIGKHYGIPFILRGHQLFNDTALALQVPYAAADTPIASQTVSTARDAGWIWDIGLTSRRGIGYTYSSAHTSDAAAEQTLLDYVKQSPGLADGDYQPRKISFQPGHRAAFWHRNCVAVGMSAGFLEPLEASALVLIELAGKMISEDLPANREVMDQIAQRYNETFLYRWERIIDFLKLHYVLSRRRDSDYWRDQQHAESMPESLSSALALWSYHVPWHNDFSRRDEVFSSASYQYVLYGMGFSTRPRPSARHAAEGQHARRLFAENATQADKLIRHLPTNRELLAHIGRHGLPRS